MNEELDFTPLQCISIYYVYMSPAGYIPRGELQISFSKYLYIWAAHVRVREVQIENKV